MMVRSHREGVGKRTGPGWAPSALSWLGQEGLSAPRHPEDKDETWGRISSCLLSTRTASLPDFTSDCEKRAVSPTLLGSWVSLHLGMSHHTIWCVQTRKLTLSETSPVQGGVLVND